MALTTLIPNDNPAYTSSNWLLHNGSGNYYSILIDNDDTTYIHSLGDDNAIMYPLTDMPVDFSFASSVTINVRENNNGIPADSFPLLFQIINGNDGVTPLTTINALYDSSSISDYSVQLSVIGATDSGTWNNALLKILTGSVNNNRITSVYEISVSLTYNVNVTDTGNLGTLNAFTTSGSLILGNSSNNDITVNLGTSDFSSIILNGSGHDVITASTSVNETFILGAAQNGGTTLNNLQLGDTVNIDGASAIAALTGDNLGTAGSVISVGEWAFNNVSDQLTYFNTVANQAESITLTGVNNVTLENGDAFIIA